LTVKAWYLKMPFLRGNRGKTIIMHQKALSLGRYIIITYLVFFLLFLIISISLLWKSIQHLALKNNEVYLETVSYKARLLLQNTYTDYLLSTNPAQQIFPREMFLLRRTEALTKLENFFKTKGISFVIWLNKDLFSYHVHNSPKIALKKPSPPSLKKYLQNKDIMFKYVYFDPFKISFLVFRTKEEAITPFKNEIYLFFCAGIFLALIALAVTYFIYYYLVGRPLERLTKSLSANELPGPTGIFEFDHLVEIVKKALDRERRLVESLAVSEKLVALGTLAGGYAHEFNNLLQVIIGNLEVASIACQDKNCPKAQDKLQTIKEASLRGAALANKILTISRTEKISAKYETDLGKILKDLEESLSHGLRREIRLTIDTQEGLGVHLSAEQVQDIIVNLVSNAKDAISGPGRISLKAYAERGNVILEVSDTGKGMDEETKKRIFDPFFTTKAPGQGTGLGLFAVYQLVKLAKGNIEVESNPNHGTRIRIILPQQSISPPPKKPPKPAQELETKIKPLRILVVDDEQSILENFRELLNLDKHHVTLASSAEEAYEKIKKDPNFHIIFLDLSMPGKGGEWLLREISKQREYDYHVVLMTGHTGLLSSETTKIFENKKNFKILHKPFSWTEIKKILKEVSSCLK